MSLPIYQDQNSKKRIARRTYAIAAGKGGVGKSMLTAHVARDLASRGYRVGVLDADLYGPSQNLMLKVDHPATQTSEGGKVMSKSARSQNIQLVSLGLFHQKEDLAAVRAPIANQIIHHFIHDTDWKELDFLFIDFPPGTGDIQLTLAQEMEIDGVYLISTPQMVCLQDVRKAASFFEKLSIPIKGFVLNMAFIEVEGFKIEPFGAFDEEAWLSTLDTKCLAQIPLDPAIAKSGDFAFADYKNYSLDAQEALMKMGSIVEESFR